MLFAATWMDLEVILREVIQTVKDKHHIILYHLHVESTKKKKKDTDELIYKTETGSQTLKTKCWLPKGRDWRGVGGGVWDWHVHMIIYKMDCLQERVV